MKLNATTEADERPAIRELIQAARFYADEYLHELAAYLDSPDESVAKYRTEQARPPLRLVGQG